MNDELGHSSTPQSEPDDKAGRRLHELMAAERDRIERDLADHDPIAFTRRLAERIIAEKTPDGYFPYEPDYAVPPGETLREHLEESGETAEELAAKAGLPVEQIEGVLGGTTQITEEVAVKLDEVTGIRAGFWLRLEANYQAALGR